MLKRTLTILLFLGLITPAVHADPWNEVNNPENMSKNYRYDFNALPLQGRVDDAHMPWSDNYWESDWAGISLRWNMLNLEQLDPEGHESFDKYAQFRYVPPSRQQVLSMSKAQLAKLSPAEKYDILMGRYDYPTVKTERERTGPEMDDWQGICHGWVPASINHEEPRPTELQGADVVVPFGSSDIKALLSHYYGVTAYDYARGSRLLRKVGNFLQHLDQIDLIDIGRWLSLPSSATAYVDEYEVDVAEMDPTKTYIGTVEDLSLVAQIGARPEKHGRTLKDPNAGAFHVVMANQLGLMRRAFVGNINKKLKNGEIWNQPIVGFNSQIVGGRDRNRGRNSVKVHTVLTYVSEIAQRWEPVVGTPIQRYDTMEFDYSLDLIDGRIVGGKWENRTKHPSFAWKHDVLPIRGYYGRLNEMSRPRF